MMLKKRLRLATLLALVFVLAITTMTHAAAPTVSMEVCVGLQESRPAGSTGEEVTWELRDHQSPNAVEFTGVGSLTSSGTKGCIDVVGLPNELYDIWIKGDDTLSILADNIQLISLATSDLSATHTLIEGDTESNNSVINSNDLFILTANANWGSANDLTDLDENGTTNSNDLFRLVANSTNWGQGAGPALATANRAAASNNSVPQAVSIQVGSATGAPGSNVIVPLTVTASPETLNGINIDIATLDPNLSFVSISPVSPFSWVPAATCTGAPIGGADCKAYINTSGGSTGTFVVANLTVTLPDVPNCGPYAVSLAPAAVPIDGNNGTFVGDSSANRFVPSIGSGVVSCFDPLATTMSSMNTDISEGSTPIVAAVLLSVLLLGVATIRTTKID